MWRHRVSLQGSGRFVGRGMGGVGTLTGKCILFMTRRVRARVSSSNSKRAEPARSSLLRRESPQGFPHWLIIGPKLIR